MKKLIILLFILCSISFASGSINPLNPTEPLHHFLRNDTTNMHEWEQNFNCCEFSEQLENNLTEHGFVCGIADLIYKHEVDGFRGHQICYVVIDGSVYFVEPQSDEIFEIEEMYLYYDNIKKVQLFGDSKPYMIKGCKQWV